MVNLEKLKELSQAKKFGKNASIIKEGAKEPFSMFIVLHGEVGIVKNYGSPAQKIVNKLGPGDFFGEMSLFLLQPRSATVIALTDCICLEINQLDSYSILEKNIDLLFYILKALCKRIDHLNSKVPM